jgi:hypothetical protein
MTLEEFALRAAPREPLVLQAGVDPGGQTDPTATVLMSVEHGRRTIREAKRLELGVRYDDQSDRLARWAIRTARSAAR